MTTIRHVRKAAKDVGAIVTYEKSNGFVWLGVEAPRGYTWSEGDVHEMVDETHAPWLPDFVDMLERMAYGISPCVDSDCDWCHPHEEDSQ